MLLWLSLVLLAAIGVLAALPPASSDDDESRPRATPGEIGIASLPAAAVTVALGWLAAHWQNYGLMVFVGLPAVDGFLAAWLLTRRHLCTARDCAIVAVCAALEAGAGFLLFGLEGFVCLAMAVPLGIPLALLGGRLAWFCQGSSWLGAGPRRPC